MYMYMYMYMYIYIYIYIYTKRYVIKILRYLCIVAVFTELLKKHNAYMIHSIISVFQKIRMTKLLKKHKKERKKEHEIK